MTTENKNNIPKDIIQKITQLFNENNFEDLEKYLNKIIRNYPNSFFLHNVIGTVFFSKGNLSNAIKSFKKVTQLNPKYSDAYNNLAVIYQKIGDHKNSIISLKSALKIDENYPEGHNNLGVTYKQIGEFALAIEHFKKAIDLKPDFFEAFNNLASTFQRIGKLDLAIKFYEKTLKIKPNFSQSLSQLLHLKRQICNWNDDFNIEKHCDKIGLTGDAIQPFSTLSLEDNPERQMLRSIQFANQKFRQSSNFVRKIISSENKKIKVGYFSSDFQSHATLYLMMGLLKSHNKEIFKIYIYSYGKEKSDSWRKLVKDNATSFYDVANYSNEKILKLAKEEELDIAIDLKGYTQNTRIELFGYRLAPIQISYLGYPGTSGSKYFDYLIADKVLIPNDYRKYYSEKIIFLPNTYQPNDNTREISRFKTNREEFYLPSDSFVFCSFNSNYKISINEFDIWMRVLKKIDNSVLWLLKSNSWAEINLKDEAKKRKIDENRLIFAEKVTPEKHLERHNHADLFLDTFNCNAHTTASDALWSGLPVVTKIGKQFAARVASSLLTAIGLPELITKNESDYEKLIINLGQNRQNLEQIKNKLKQNSKTYPLFDTKLYTNKFEKALRTIYENKKQNLDANDLIIN